MEQKRAWEANKRSICQEVLCILRNSMGHYYFPTSSNLGPIPIYRNTTLFHTLTFYFFKIGFGSTLRHTPGSPKWSFLTDISYAVLVFPVCRINLPHRVYRSNIPWTLRPRSTLKIIVDPCSRPMQTRSAVLVCLVLFAVCSCHDPLFITSCCWAWSCGNHGLTRDLQMCSICPCKSRLLKS
jgi:hypothetical protein